MSRIGATLITGVLLVSLSSLGVVDHLLQGHILLSPQQESTEENILTAMQYALTENNIAFRRTEEAHMYTNLVTDTQVHTLTLFHDRDRIGSIAFAQSPHAFAYFSALKEVLSLSFSPDVEDLEDQELHTSTQNPIHILQFYDPNLNTERMVFGATGNILFEVHIAEMYRKTIEELIETLFEIQH
ncbi:hypothetical protein COU77_02615 [Candidatus Peregrinibacteria bacterium CG10_big_fil_rev_8_21_14_0_10_49_16]|nr:MAG: hypothetical protein COW95_04660 [Candidatus Peregrinibacteria bacterium CG22_combo_CG10-13_8_21_14_all_49_11]PIR51933.1 MAG: hypothetical protein COU77_02615 [Candidatus Peregrinibacteria bacterium CG10_big_fil_rev_8_21_14_0_10_49_16]